MNAAVPVVVVLATEAGPLPPELSAALGALEPRVRWRVTDEDGLADAVGGAHALLLWDFFSSALAGAWERCDVLEWVHVAAAGVDTLLFDELVESSVVLTNARGTFDRPIAEFVLASVLAHAKLLHPSRDLQRRRVWQHRETRSLVGRRAMVVGVGGIGRESARLLRALGMTVLGAGRTERQQDPDFDRVVASTDLAAHLGGVDYLVNAAPLTPATTGLIDAAVLGALPAGAHLVNVGRGPTVVEADVVDALRAGRLDGASLDVFAVEPLPEGSPLWDLPGVVVSAHLSGDVVGWKDALAEQFAANLERWLDGQPLLTVVDKRLGFAAPRP